MPCQQISTCDDVRFFSGGDMAFTERRGYPPRLRDFADVTAARNVLADEQVRQRIGAEQKNADPGHWGNVGEIEIAALRQTESLLAGLADETDATRFVAAAHQALVDLATRFRNDDWDADGFGLGTVLAIQRVLESHD